MAAIRGKNTKPELVVRRTAHALGYRFRLHRRDLPGTPDLVFASRRSVILVHGCFWHRHPACRYATTPATNREFWDRKFRRNVERDEADVRMLEAAGWRVRVVWECDTRDLVALRALLVAHLGPPSAAVPMIAARNGLPRHG